jgi:hypothetical protein
MDSHPNTISYKCSRCDEIHHGLPALAYSAPFYWDEGLANDPQSELSPDTCVIESRDYFIRCVLEIPVIGHSEPLSWGVWLSQSQSNFLSYLESDRTELPKSTFGYVANAMPDYPETLDLMANAVWQPKGSRPLVELEIVDHPLVSDWQNGITLERAIAFAELCLHPE